MNETGIEREYKHFLRYDQNCIFDIEYGFTDLYFDINQTAIFVKKIDHSNELEKELQFPLKFDSGSIIDELEHFLITLMSDKIIFRVHQFLFKAKYSQLHHLIICLKKLSS